jgi:hypothetical protein
MQRLMADLSGLLMCGVRMSRKFQLSLRSKELKSEIDPRIPEMSAGDMEVLNCDRSRLTTNLMVKAFMIYEMNEKIPL